MASRPRRPGAASFQLLGLVNPSVGRMVLGRLDESLLVCFRSTVRPLVVLNKGKSHSARDLNRSNRAKF